MKKTILLILILLTAWREILFLFGQISDKIFYYSPSFPYSDQVLERTETLRWVYSWANFDGVHYLTIVEKGYWGIALVQAFFPFYPILIKAISQIFGIKVILSALFISFVSFTAFILMWFALLKERYSYQFAWKTLLIVILFPTAFFFVSAYSESLFLLSLVSTWYFVKNKKWWFVAVSIMIASSTRLIGILLIPSILMDLFFIRYTEISVKRSFSFPNVIQGLVVFLQKDWSKILIVSLGCIGLMSYMVYLQLQYQDPLSFFHVQEDFGAGRDARMVILPQVFWRSIKILATVEQHDWKYFSYIQDTFFSLLFLVLGVIGFIKRKSMRISFGELFFASGAYLIPTLTGTFSSMPRYVMVCLPLFVVLSHLLSTKRKLILWLIFSSLLLTLNTFLFLQGYWIA